MLYKRADTETDVSKLMRVSPGTPLLVEKFAQICSPGDLFWGQSRKCFFAVYLMHEEHHNFDHNFVVYILLEGAISKILISSYHNQNHLTVASEIALL